MLGCSILDNDFYGYETARDQKDQDSDNDQQKQYFEIEIDNDSESNIECESNRIPIKQNS